MMHLCQAFLMLLYPSAAGATPTLALLSTLHALYRPDGPHLMSAIMMATADLALVGAMFPVGRWRLAMLLPQHLILGIMALGGWLAVSQGAYLDGTVIPWPHILVDQVTVTAIWVMHSNAILRRARAP